ncbi:hypothetical protein LTR37_000834 [Vermiconidia calcicola]|uniref:Uncharacterized protein n=1 Tax=Vermiconidia calcicola TaxID=1690605 RepID=A0ACC3NXK2_9PEZI|nr:hypothetical protein LTR37_000834 [Vermiconidia calcicola]
MNRYCGPRPKADLQHNVCTGTLFAANDDGKYYDAAFVLPARAHPIRPLGPCRMENSLHDPLQQTGFYQQQYPSQAHLPTTQPRELRRQPSMWSSTVELASAERNQPQVQERGWQSTGRAVAGPSNNPFNEYSIATSMIRAAACCDTVAERLHEALCRLNYGPEGNEHSVPALAREMPSSGSQYRGNGRPERPAAEVPPQERSRGSLINLEKASMYSNSRLEPWLMPYRVYTATWQLFCYAANASADVYQRPRRGEREDYIRANWRQGTKAMVLKSTPLDNKNIIVIAIRGSQWNVVDWAVNFTFEPVPPVGFLDDEGNACHEGFLQVARSMVKPVATRLRSLIEQDPSRATCSLLFTGHSAGGAIANLLYMHMLSEKARSELTDCNGIFKRVHCVTFGVPPMSLLPLQNPAGRGYKNNQFVSFVNEGDPIVRADFAYMKSLVRLFAAPAPKLCDPPASSGLRKKMSRQALMGTVSPPAKHSAPPSWPVPAATLSNAGRLVLLRKRPQQPSNVEAACTSDDELRGILFGDHMMHSMMVYRERVHGLATASVTGRDAG